jgi:hypothetical protein
MKRGRLQVIGLILAFASVASSQIIMPNPIGGSGGGGSALTTTALAAATTCVDSGANDTYTCDLTPAITSYAQILYLPITVRFNTANTGAATLNINGVGAAAIVKPVNTTATTALQTGDITTTDPGIVVWDGTQFRLKSIPNSTINGSGGNSFLAGTTAFGASSTLTIAGTWSATNNLTMGGVTAGWILSTSGEVASNADYTNATASFTVTPLSTTLVSGRTYSFTFVGFFTDSTAADGAQFDFNGGTATVTNFRAHCTAANNAGAALVITNAASTALATAVQVALALTSQSLITCQGTFVPSGNGTFIVRAAQTAHSTGTLTVHRGSWLSVTDSRPL